MNKKLKLIIEIVIFIVALCAITGIYYFSNTNKEKNEEEAANVGIIKVTDENFSTEILESDKPVILEFTSNSCPPCVSLLPTLINIAKNNKDIKVATMNIDAKESANTISKYKIEATPTIMIIKDGQVTETILGATNEDKIM
ncbi:MAG: thioredoxin family protein, partial [Bacilli bacterium]|nr:thioredoxin family protein [Bacilli bacterium]